MERGRQKQEFLKGTYTTLILVLSCIVHSPQCQSTASFYIDGFLSVIVYINTHAQLLYYLFTSFCFVFNHEKSILHQSLSSLSS